MTDAPRETVEHEWSADQLEAAVHKALADHNFEAVVDVLKVMVAWYPERGIALYDEIQEALVIAKFLHGR